MARDVFVDVDWLVPRINDPSLAIIDTRSTPHGSPGAAPGPTGREAYAAGHLPGAIHLDYATDLHDERTPYAARVAAPERFARAVGGAGIGNVTTVIAYDDGTVPYAARLVWMLEYYGHEAAYILAGGYTAWVDAGFPTTTDLTKPRRRTFLPHVHEGLRASRDEVLAAVEGHTDSQIVETQRDATYAQRDRDIKGAIRLSGSALLEDARGGRIAVPGRLRELVHGSKLDRSKRTIVSCGSGVSASGSFFALREAGFTNVAVYDGSWMEWNHDGLPTVPKASS